MRAEFTKWENFIGAVIVGQLSYLLIVSWVKKILGGGRGLKDRKVYVSMPIEGSVGEYKEHENLLQSHVGHIVTAQVLEGIHALYLTGKLDMIISIPVIPERSRIILRRSWLESLFQHIDNTK